MRTSRRILVAVAALLLALGALAIAAVASDPYRLVRLEFARQRLAAHLERRSVVIDDHTWIYAASDAAPPDAPTLVLVHGFTGSKENWYPLARLLRGRYRLLIPDLPGWGESTRRAGADYGYAAQAQRLARFIETVAGDRPVVLVGHSMGGGIAALAAARFPGHVRRLALIDAAGADNAVIAVDTLHFHRSRCRPEELENLPLRLFGSLHLCDAPGGIPTTVEGLIHTGRAERLYLGEGGIDVASIVRHALPGMICAIEIPHLERVDVIGSAEHAHRALETAKSYLQANGL